MGGIVARIGHPLVVIIIALSVLMTIWGMGSLFIAGTEHIPDRPDPLDFFSFATMFLVFPLVGGVVAWKRPENMVGWLFLAIGFLLVLSVFATEYAGREMYTGVILPGAVFVAWIGNLGWFIAGGTALPLAIATFPTGEHLSGRWRIAFRLTTGAVLLVVVAGLVKPGWIESYEGYFANPLGIGGFLGELAAATYSNGTVVLILPIGLAIASLVVRFRRSSGIERQQLKWLLLPALLVVIGIVTAAITEAEHAWTLMLFGLTFVPIGAGIAILRYRLYDIDVVIRRTLVYGAVVAVLAATYVGLVLVLQTALSQVTGGDTLPVALSTLAIAALFGPVRARVRAWVDRRFYRSRYDAQRTVEGFAGALRDRVELDTVVASLAQVARSTVAPASVSMWLRRRPG